ncbi:hypothetical protein CCP1ISM_90027 [Azospirillaceae bacterium]
MNLRSITVENYVQSLTEEKEISSTALTLKIHSYYAKHLQPVNYDKITSVINDLVSKEIICKKGQNYSIVK